MNRLQIKAEVKRIVDAYPVFTNLMVGAWNEHSEVSGPEEAARHYAAMCSGFILQRLLDDLSRAEKDKALHDMMRDERAAIELCRYWGHRVPFPEDLPILKETVEACLKERGPTVVRLKRA